MASDDSPSQMLYEMCHDVLSVPDIKAICRSRGFSEKEAASRSLFEHVFLSSNGVANAMRALSATEVAVLHLHGQIVDVTFFGRLYDGESPGYGTITQQFRPVFDAVQRNLVRKGLLLLGVARTNSPTKTKMELWRYRFPAEFAPFLPPLFQPRVFGEAARDEGVDPLRMELHRLVQDRPTSRERAAGHLRIVGSLSGSSNQGVAAGDTVVQCVAGSLTLAGRPFSVEAVWAWRQAAWERAIINGQRANASPSSAGAAYIPHTAYGGFLTSGVASELPGPLPFLRYVLGQLGPGQWVVPEQLRVPLNVVYPGSADSTAAAICRAGWETGCLVRHQAEGAEYYRLADTELGPAPAGPETWLPATGGTVAANLERIPYGMLEFLNRIADFRVKDGRLQVMPNLAGMAQTWDAVRDHALLPYLRARSSAFRAMLEKIDAEWGTLNIHENLLVARITDLSLRVSLRQALCGESAPSPQPVFLSDEYVAFPRARLGEIERLVKRAGHVIRTVHAT